MSDEKNTENIGKGENDILDVVDLEEYANAGKPVPAAKLYRLQIDKKKYETANPKPNGREILALADKEPENWKLYLHVPGHQPKQIGPTDIVDLRHDGVERFTTMAKDTTDGRSTPRRQFRMPPDDERYLDSRGFFWETVTDGSQWLIIHDWVLPSGYSVSRVSIALLIPSSYPDGEIDMVYVLPALSRIDGKPIAALSNQPIAEENWQRWSRHRTGQNPWRLGIDDVSTHLTLVDEWFGREFGA
jgi:hypothetical protein